MDNGQRGVQLFAITDYGPQPLPAPAGASGFDDLYDGLALGVYSVWCTFDHNKFLALDAHLARIRRSMAMLGWTYAFDEARFRKALHQVCTASPWPEARVRLDVLAGPAHQLGSDSRELLALIPFTPPPPELYEEGVTVDFAPGLVRERPLAKTAAFAIRRRDYPTGIADAYERLLVDDDGRILECTGANFYAVRDGVVYTAGDGVLAGVTRRIILDLIPQLDIPLRLEPVRVDKIGALDEAALSSSSRALIPIVRIGRQVVGDGRPGPISRRILAAYQDYVVRHIETAVRGNGESASDPF